MPIKVSDSLPAVKTLEGENIFIMSEERANRQDIRPLQIVILNLMPKKIETETQLLRLMSNTPLQVDIELMLMSTHESKNTSSEHLDKFYHTFDELKSRRFDGLIITGAPVEKLDFEQVDYWQELTQIMQWSKTNVYSTFHICWGAQAALYYHYGINKYPLDEKMFGLFSNNNLAPDHPILRGFDEKFLVPHSRHTANRTEDVEAHPDLEVLSSGDAGLYMAASKDSRMFFVTGHSEYDRYTLAQEYYRDLDKGLAIKKPVNYFPGDNPSLPPEHSWRAHAHLLYANWLNYYVYQNTPFDLTDL